MELTRGKRTSEPLWIRSLARLYGRCFAPPCGSQHLLPIRPRRRATREGRGCGGAEEARERKALSGPISECLTTPALNAGGGEMGASCQLTLPRLFLSRLTPGQHS